MKHGALMMITAFAPSVAGAAGYYLPNQDAYATAKGNAYVATADSAASVFYNPAGMTQLEEARRRPGCIRSFSATAPGSAGSKRM
ncbi:MAG: hypothetical protein H7A50_12740 [Akkermansiaceae bacterium]|nr:hypothetical protein [Akkermansiaceae bacterium]